MSRRKATELRKQVESASDAPRYLSITEFAKRHDVTTQQLNRWMRTGSVWVPTPAVVVGEIERPGWEEQAVDGWERGALGVERPEPRRYLNVTQMCDLWHVTPDTLWACIAKDKTVRGPDMWLVHGLKTDPGWLPTK